MQSELRTTPKGEAVRPRLNSVDTRHTAIGVYHTLIRFNASDAAPIIGEIDEARATSLTWAKRSAKSEKASSRIKLAESLPYEVVDDGSDDVLIKFRMKGMGTAWTTTRQKQAPAIFAANAERSQRLVIGHGDIIRVSYVIAAYYTAAVGAGVTLDMRSVQLITPAGAWTRSAEHYGFTGDDADTPAGTQTVAAA